MNARHSIQRWLRYPSLTALAGQESVMGKARIVVQFFYTVLPFMAFLFFVTYQTPLVQQNFSAIWPLSWSSLLSFDTDTVVNIVRSLFLVTSFVGLLFYRHKMARLVVFLGIWQAHALASSFFGAPNHQWYPWLFVSFIFIFLPDGELKNTSIAENREYLLVVWWSQAFFMLIYSMAGFWKFFEAFQQYLAGEVNGFSSHAFAIQVANWVPKLQEDALLAPFVIEHPYIGWPFYVLSHCFQLFAMWTMVRPSLQRIWGVELVLFHIATYLTMGINFSQFIPLLLILFYNSPFVPERISFRDILIDLPIVGWLLERKLR